MNEPRIVRWQYEPHCFKADRPVAKLVGRAVCVKCGLLRLKNLLTEWCVAKGCYFDESPGYRDALRTLPRQHEARRL